MKLLVLGGTVFVGRRIVQAALARKHEAALFNRGQSNPELYPECEKLIGDRDGDVSALRGRSFDAVIDVSGYRPEQLRRVIEALGGRIPHYTFISTISVYRRLPPGRPYDEGAPTEDGTDGYGALKARCEEAVDELLPGRAAHVRAGLIVGPHDPTGRFGYWPRRLARGGDVLAPGRPQRPVQFIDARDLARWCVLLAENRAAGRFNAVGPARRLTMAEFLGACRAASNSESCLHWVPDEQLASAGVQPWTELPLWVPENDPDAGGVMLADNRKAAAAGLTFRPAAETIKDTLVWELGRGEAAPGAGLSADRERELLSGRSTPR